MASAERNLLNKKWKYEFQSVPMLSVFILTTLKQFYHLTFFILGFDLLLEVVGLCIGGVCFPPRKQKKQGCPYISTTSIFLQTDYPPTPTFIIT